MATMGSEMEGGRKGQKENKLVLRTSAGDAAVMLGIDVKVLHLGRVVDDKRNQ